MDRAVILKPGKEKSLNQRHPWIFSGAIASLPSFEDGDVLSVYSSDKKYLASAYFHHATSIAGRVLSFEQKDLSCLIQMKIQDAVSMRRQLFSSSTTGYRLINAEGDGLPGLIVDFYDGVLVIQISTCGMERLKPVLLEHLIQICNPIAIYEKSCSSSREKEGLQPFEGHLYGEKTEEVVFLENGLRFISPLTNGQKTGFFFDQREMRALVQKYAEGKRVLNCFSYTGGFSLYGLKGGAGHITTVDVSRSAIDIAKRNFALNDYPAEKHSFIETDAFDFLRKSKMDFDLVILDPPAFAKKRSDVVSACRGYKDINRLVMEKIPSNSYLLTCSCSYFLEPSPFTTLLFQAASEAGRSVQILHSHIQAADHPVSIFHPEGNYLKSSFLLIK